VLFLSDLKEDNMAKEKQILLMHFDGYSQRDICVALKCGHERVGRLIAEASKAGLDREAICNIDNIQIVRLLMPPENQPPKRHAMPDFERLSKELEKPDVTRKLLWYEYCTDITGENLVPYQYAQFCRLFDGHLAKTKATYRIKHEPGRRMFVDWAGSVGHITDAVVGSILDVYIFVACLPYSAMLYAEGFMDMKQPSWTSAHVHTFEYFGGVPAILVPDNTKTAVSRASIHATLINERYEELATHYGCAVIPARPRRSNDKALVENGVNIVEKSILAAFRNDTFFTLAELNEAILRKIDAINAAPFQKRPGSRLGIFESEEKMYLRRLPIGRFELPEYRTAKVAPDYHVQVDTMRYSVPYKLIGKQCEIRFTTTRTDIMSGGKIVASHDRLHGKKGQYSTKPEHMPPAHAAYDAKWTPERYQRWADSIGPGTRTVIDRVLSGKVVVEQAFVPCMNILGLARNSRRDLLEKACGSIIAKGQAPTYSLVKNTMEAIKASQRLAGISFSCVPGEHGSNRLRDEGCVRGSGYYRGKKGGKDGI
jgi:transposase